MDFECMKKVIAERNSCRMFTGEPIKEGVMEEILAYSLRCPTSMNTQPYKMILVRDQEKKEALAQYMEGGNSNTVKSSGALVVVCADQQPVESVKDFGQYVYSDDMSPKIRGMMKYAFVTYYNNTIMNFCFGWIIDFFLWIARLFRPSPSRISNQAWSFQQASFLIQDLCLLSQSKGVSSLIIEGFSHKEIRELCNIPKRYQIAALVAFGYAPKVDNFVPSPRFPFEKMFYDKMWGNAFM